MSKCNYKYIGKRALYEMVKTYFHGKYEMPKCKYCFYRRYGGYERLHFYLEDSNSPIVEFTTLHAGAWNHIILKFYDDFDNEIVRDYVVTHIREGKFYV